MRSRICLWCGAAAVLVLVAPAAAAARFAPISGALSKRGYTVIAMATNDTATSVRASHGGFSLRPRAGSVTLQLRAPNGIYAGPVVIGSDQHGAHSIVGVRAGARLGRITVNSARGYARVARRVAKGWVDTSRWARARKGVPIGAGNFGRVRSKPPRHPPPGDLDADGVPDRLDIDINGNLILYDVDRSTLSLARISQAESPFWIGTSLFGGWYGNAVNANARARADRRGHRPVAREERIRRHRPAAREPRARLRRGPGPQQPTGLDRRPELLHERRHRRRVAGPWAIRALPGVL